MESVMEKTRGALAEATARALVAREWDRCRARCCGASGWGQTGSLNHARRCGGCPLNELDEVCDCLALVPVEDE